MRRSICRVVSSCLFSALFFVDIAAAGVMGRTGQFAVSPSGAATYSLPIRVAPGTAGIEPRLSLDYNSQAGNGHLGVGWSLGGLSMIERCARTVAQDGILGSINYDADDRFCIGGKRLMVVSGIYGADGAEYRTEQDEFSKIVSYGASGSGPLFFKIWTKSGQVLEIGNAVNARMVILIAQALGGGLSNPIKGWALNRLQDVKGNYLTVEYVNDSAKDDFYPLRIDYTGNASTGIIPDNSVLFQYDPKPVYSASSANVSIVKLAKVQILSKNLTSEYRLNYEVGPTTSRARLLSVTECISGGTCLAPINFSWERNLPAAQNLQWTGHRGGTNGWQLADLFGDGRKVFWTRSGSTHYATRLNVDGSVENWQWSGHGSGTDGWELVNLFGDGREVYWTRSGSTHYATRLNADKTVENWTWTGGHSGGTYGSNFADLFGDGRKVYWTRSGGNNYATRLNANNTVENWQWTGRDLGIGTAHADLFGDGRQIHVASTREKHFATQLNADHSLQSWEWDARGYGGYRWSVADLFGDGRPVYWTYTFNDGTFRATRLTRDNKVQNWDWLQPGLVQPGFGEPNSVDLFGNGSTVLWGQIATDKFYAVRLNLDGTVAKTEWAGVVTGAFGGEMVDLFGTGHPVYWTYTDSRNFATQFNSDGTFKSWQWSGHGIGKNDGKYGWQFADLFGTGRQAFWTRSGTTHLATQFFPTAADQMLGITTGLGATTTIAYKPLTDNSVYTKDDVATYPLQDVQEPIYVVSSVASENGVGGSLTTNYTYGGLKQDHSGRGSLGFRWIRASHVDTGISILTEYRQDWPYTGMPFLLKKTLPGSGSGGVLSQIGSYYGCNNIAGAFGCTVTPGTIYFPHLLQSTTSSWDLNGTPLPSTRMTLEYDKFGNRKRIESVAADGSSTFTTVTTNVFTNNETNWLLGLRDRETVTKSTTLPAPTDPYVGAWSGNPGVNSSNGGSTTSNPSGTGTSLSNINWITPLPASLIAGRIFSFSVQVTGVSGLSGNVTFSDGRKVLAIQSLDAVGKAAFTGYLTTPGPATVTATYSGDERHSPSSVSASTTVKSIDMTAILMLLMD